MRDLISMAPWDLTAVLTMTIPRAFCKLQRDFLAGGLISSTVVVEGVVFPGQSLVLGWGDGDNLEGVALVACGACGRGFPELPSDSAFSTLFSSSPP